MKNNTGQSKEHLLQALKNLPNDFALSEVRFHLKTALGKLENVESKRQKRESQQSANNNWVVVNGEIMHPEMAKKVVNQLDRLIDAEKIRIEAIKSKKKELLNGDDEDIQALFG